MRKVVMSLVCVMALAVARPASAQETATPPTEVAPMQQEKTEIKAEDLPETVKKTLMGEAYEGWAIEKAFKITEENKADIFEIQAKKGEESATMQFDEEGKKIEM